MTELEYCNATNLERVRAAIGILLTYSPTDNAIYAKVQKATKNLSEVSMHLSSIITTVE